MENIGVALTTYNRPEHTAIVLETLKYVKPLYVFSDGPKDGEDAKAVHRVRELVSTCSWGNPFIIAREQNVGLAKSIVGAVDFILERYEAIILLEDDCLPGPYFFDFMYDCLEKYQDDERVFGITGYTVPLPRRILDDYAADAYFFPRIGSWGWATWRRAWQRYERNLFAAHRKALEARINLSQGGRDIPGLIKAVCEGLDAWTMEWILATYLHHGVYVYPTTSHVQNIGMDGTGVHCGETKRFDTPLSQEKSSRLPEDIVFDQRILRTVERAYGLPNKTLSLSGEREIEWAFVKERLPAGGGSVLDLGPDELHRISSLAIERGYDVTAIGLEDTRAPIGYFVMGDFLEMEITDMFDIILVISTIEHFGLSGRYGIDDESVDADLDGMAKVRSIIKPYGTVLLTIPVGQDANISPWHRVYGRKRLGLLLDGYDIIEEKYWAKDHNDNYLMVDKDTALNTYPCGGPHFYYALAQFTLKVKHPIKSFVSSSFCSASEIDFSYCTLCDRKSLPKLAALYESMQRHCPETDLWVLATDERCEAILTQLNWAHVTVVAMDDFADHAVYKTGRGIIPTWILFVCRNAPGEGVLYLDVASYFFSSVEPLYKEIGNSTIALSPCRYSYKYTKNYIAGLYRPGGIFVRKSQPGIACIRAWRRNLGERKHLDAWPAEFAAHVIENRGWNLTPTSQIQYEYSPRGREICIDGKPVIMYHFDDLQIRDEIKRVFHLSGCPLAAPVENYIYTVYIESLRGALLKLPETQLLVPEMPPEPDQTRIVQIPISNDFDVWMQAIGKRQTDGLTAEHLGILLRYVSEYRPSLIVDIISGCGLSLRTWLCTEVQQIVAIGEEMGALYESWRVLPLNLERIRWAKKSIYEIDFAAMWGQEKVLFYFTLHSREMGQYLIAHAIRKLPEGSLVIINDIQYNLARGLIDSPTIEKGLITYQL